MSDNICENIMSENSPDYVYSLFQDNEPICYSFTLEGIKTVIESKISELRMIHLPNVLTITGDEYDEREPELSIFVSINHANFIWSYPSVLSAFKIVKVPLFSTIL